MHKRKGAGLLVPRQVAFQQPVLGRDGGARQDVLADRGGAEGDHVLPRRVAGVKGAHHVYPVRLHLDGDVEEPSVRGAPRHGGAEQLGLAGGPEGEARGLPHGGEDETGRPLELRRRGQADRASRLADEPRSAVVARHQRPFRGGEWHVEVAGGMRPPDPQRTDETRGDLRHPDEVLDVPPQLSGIRQGRRPR